jgi:hypothetical protein
VYNIDSKGLIGIDSKGLIGFNRYMKGFIPRSARSPQRTSPGPAAAARWGR